MREENQALRGNRSGQGSACRAEKSGRPGSGSTADGWGATMCHSVSKML